MAAPVPHSYPDVFGPVPQGVNSGLAPTLLQPTQLAWGVNVTCRGGYVRNRPPYLKVTLTFPDETTQERATEAIFQGASYYNSFGNNPSCIIASIGGCIFRYTITNRKAAVQEMTPANDPNNPTFEQAWLAQGQDFLVINDGQNRPLVFDGASVKRLPDGTWLPVGRQIHYVNGRFIVATPPPSVIGPAYSYIASDLVYSTVSGTPQYNYRDSILRTTENFEILAGTSFAVPLNSGPITSLFSVAIPDTSLGQGPLQIGTTDGIYSVNLPLDATLWLSTDPPSQTISLPSPGPTGFYGVSTVNGDAWYRAPDGLRSFVVARRDFNTWVQTPLSFELERILPYDTPSLLEHSSTLSFNNRLLCTCSPYRVRDRGIAHRGLVALDFNNISSITQRSQPAYDGLWTGIPILQLVKGRFHGVERAFAFVLDGDNKIALYELGLDKVSLFDHNGTEDVPMECWIESCAMLGREGDQRANQLKRLLAADLWLDELSGTGDGNVTVTTSWRPDHDPCYRDWQSFALCAPSCAQPEPCEQPMPTHPQYATFLRLPQPADDCNPTTGRPYRTFYHAQLKLEWTGHLSVHDAMLWASPQPENLDSRTCSSSPTCRVLQCCGDDLFTYSIEAYSSTTSIEWDVDSGAAVIDSSTGSTITSTPT